ncbi:MAG: heavy-metal-associated domain-containing protein [Patescibacteria group bacterium]
MIRTITLHPSRIGCPSIPGTMKGIVMSFPGVSDVKIRYEDRSIDVVFDDERVSKEKIKETIGSEMGLAMVEGEPGAKREGGAAETCPM